MLRRKIAKKLAKWKKARRGEPEVAKTEASNDPSGRAETSVLSHLEADLESDVQFVMENTAAKGAELGVKSETMSGVKAQIKSGALFATGAELRAKYKPLKEVDSEAEGWMQFNMKTVPGSDAARTSEIGVHDDANTVPRVGKAVSDDTSLWKWGKEAKSTFNVGQAAGSETWKKTDIKNLSNIGALGSASAAGAAVCKRTVASDIGAENEERTKAVPGEESEERSRIKYEVKHGVEAREVEVGEVKCAKLDAEETPSNKMTRFHRFNKRMKSIFPGHLFKTAQRKLKKSTPPNLVQSSPSLVTTPSKEKQKGKGRKKSPPRSSTVDFGRRCSYGLVPMSTRYYLDDSSETDSTLSTLLTLSIEDSKEALGQITTLDFIESPSPISTPPCQFSPLISWSPPPTPPPWPPEPLPETPTAPSSEPNVAGTSEVAKLDVEEGNSQLEPSQSAPENIVDELTMDELNPLSITKLSKERHSLPRVVAVHLRKNPLPAEGKESCNYSLPGAKSCPDFINLTMEAFKAYIGLSTPLAYDYKMAIFSEQELHSEAETRRTAQGHVRKQRRASGGAGGAVETGEAGEAGEAGETGEAGEAGETGQAGEAGEVGGANGADGTGETGRKGTGRDGILRGAGGSSSPSDVEEFFV